MDLMAVFLLGFFSCAAVALGVYASDIEFPFGVGNNESTPVDRVSLENVTIVGGDKLLIDFGRNISLSSYASTGSMSPVFDEKSNGIRIVPTSADEIDLGDIITFEDGSKLIVHRVIEKGYDDKGLYFITKGDHNDFSDGKVRYEDVKFITVGVLY